MAADPGLRDEKFGLHALRNMRCFLVPMAITLGAAACGAAEQPEVRVTPDVAYLAADRAEKLDLYQPTKPAGDRGAPAVVWIHGGGWMGGTKNEARAKEICITLAQAGYVAVSIDYKLGAGAWPQDLFDCKNAVRYLRSNARKLGVDPNRIAVAGGSAGGHLALMVGFTTGKPGLEPEDRYPGVSSAVRGVIDMYGPADLLTRRETDKQGNPGAKRRSMGTSLTVFGAKSEDDPVLRAASPVSHVAANVPPVLILHGRADTTVDYLQSQELADALQRVGAQHELMLIDGVGHTFAWQTWGRKKLTRDLRPIALAFLARNMPAK